MNKQQKIGIGLVMGLILGGILFMRFRGELRFEFSELSSYVVLLFSIAVVAAVTLIVQVIIHELGHMVAGLHNHYDWIGFQILGFSFYKNNGKTRVRFDGLNAALGLSIMLPKEAATEENHIAYYRGGYLANALTLIPLTLLLIGLKDDRIYFFTAILVTLFLLYTNMKPHQQNLNLNDAGLIELQRDPEAHSDFMTFQDLQNKLVKGTRPRDFPMVDISKDPTIFRLFINLYMFYKGLDSGDVELMKETIQPIEQEVKQLEPIQQLPFLYELIYYYVVADEDLVKAQTIFHQIEKKLTNDLDINGRRVYAYYANRIWMDPYRTERLIEEGLSAYEQYPLLGIAQMERDLLLELKKSIEQEIATK